MKTRHAFLRIQWLALAVMGGAFCIVARSQTVTLSIAPAIHVTWPTTTNVAYQVETSTSVSGTYVPTGGLIEGSGGTVGAFFNATTPAQFFRVQETAASGVNWLEGVWQGTTYQASSNAVPFTTRLAITNSDRIFSGVYSNNTFGCTAVLNLLSYSDDEASFYSKIQSGPCVDGIIVVTRVNSTNAFYNWYYITGPTVASAFAVLSKSP